MAVPDIIGCYYLVASPIDVVIVEYHNWSHDTPVQYRAVRSRRIGRYAVFCTRHCLADRRVYLQSSLSYGAFCTQFPGNSIACVSTGHGIANAYPDST
eukprot:3159264-Rhodomonas_salina.1